MNLTAVPMVIYSFVGNLVHFPEAGQHPPGPGIWWQGHPFLSLSEENPPVGDKEID